METVTSYFDSRFENNAKGKTPFFFHRRTNSDLQRAIRVARIRLHLRNIRKHPSQARWFAGKISNAATITTSRYSHSLLFVSILGSDNGCFAATQPYSRDVWRIRSPSTRPAFNSRVVNDVFNVSISNNFFAEGNVSQDQNMSASFGFCNFSVAWVIFIFSSLFFASPVVPSSYQSIAVSSGPRYTLSSKTAAIITQQLPAGSIENRALSITPQVDNSPGHSKRHTHITDQLSHLNPSLDKRSQLSSFVDKGYKLIWQTVEVILNSAEAYDRHNRIYHKLLEEVEKPVSSTSDPLQWIGNAATLAITLGSLRLTMENLPGDYLVAHDAIQQFALEMLAFCTVGMTYGIYELAIVTTQSVIWVTLQIIENGPVPEIIGR